jgi:hypothetical protein
MSSKRIAAVVLAALPGLAQAHSVVTYHNSNQRHGAYEIHDLTPTAAATMHRDTGFNASVSGHIYAQPLFWKPNDSQHGLVVVATESNIVYALDEVSGAEVWHTQLAASVPLSELQCGNIDPDGITGTPVIDPDTATLYLDALTDTANGPRHMVYALSLSNGQVVPGWPLDVQAALAATGVTFLSNVQGERSAVLFFGNNLYVNYGGNAGDCGQYRGTVVQVATNPPTLVGSWQTRARGGGIWAQGGLAGYSDSLFVTTGNTFGVSTWSDGEAIVRLRPGLAHSNRTKDYFAPSNWQTLDSTDKDLGGTEALPLNIVAVGGALPVHRVIAFGKDGNAYLNDRVDLGGIGGQLAVLPVSNVPIRTAPAVYQTQAATMVALSTGGSNQCSGQNVTMLNVTANAMSFAWCAAYRGAGAPILTTTDGVANPIVWVVGAEGDNLLHGFDGLTGAPVFTGTGTAMTGLHHFATILATPWRFYVAADNTVYAFTFQHQ